MDIQHLIDRLEELFNESRGIPLTHSVVIDEDRFLDIIDQMRVSIPEEVKKAQQVLVQRDRVLAQAQEEANRTIALARDKSEQLTGKDVITESARKQAEEIIGQAQREAEAARHEADEYVVETLTRLEVEMDRSLSQVRNGIKTLQAEHRNKNNPPQA
jgi:cell division septum initiation protein DivIVA